MAAHDQIGETGGEQIAREVVDLVQQYFELVFSNDPGLFDQLFHEQARAYGISDGAVLVWSASEYKDVLAKRLSPKTLGAPREEEIILIDLASTSQACAKVKVRINQSVFVDYLTMLKQPQGWRIVSKTYTRLSESILESP